MKSFFFIFTMISLCACNFSYNDFKITKESLDILRQKVSNEVYQYEDHPFKDMTADDIKRKLGLLGLPSNTILNLPEGKQIENLPTNFLTKERWPECNHPIRDQKKCGSCWAFAASEVLSDRFCIRSGGKINVILSAQDMVSCDKHDYGCSGGYLDKSWKYLIQEGIVTDECYPYTSGSGDSGTCQLGERKCMNPNIEYKKYYAEAFYNFKSINDIKSDIYKNGPLETGFLVYSDFISYKSGIYRKNSDELLGGHAVKIVGWGLEEETNTSYWVVANSWGTNWGEDGFFRFEIGNCCNMEAQAIAGTPRL